VLARVDVEPSGSAASAVEARLYAPPEAVRARVVPTADAPSTSMPPADDGDGAGARQVRRRGQPRRGLQRDLQASRTRARRHGLRAQPSLLAPPRLQVQTGGACESRYYGRSPREGRAIGGHALEVALAP